MINEDPLKIYDDIIKIANEEFKEEDHPRDSGGQFTSKGGGDGGSDYEEPKNDYDDIEEETIPKKNEYTELMDEKQLKEYEDHIKADNEEKQWWGIGRMKKDIEEAEDILEEIKDIEDKGYLDFYYLDSETQNKIKKFYHWELDDPYKFINKLDEVRNDLKKYIADREESISNRENYIGSLHSQKYMEKSNKFFKQYQDIMEKIRNIKFHGVTDEEAEKPEWYYDWEKNDQNWIDMNKWDFENWLDDKYDFVRDNFPKFLRKKSKLSDYELGKFDDDKKKRKYAEKKSKTTEKELNDFIDEFNSVLNKMIYVSKLRNK